MAGDENKILTGLFFNRLSQDAKFALRRFRQSLGFALSVVATLAVGLAAACAMFTVINRVMLRPLPYEKPDELVEIKEAGSRGTHDYGGPFLDVQEWRQRSHTLKEIAFYSANNHVSFLDGDNASFEVIAPRISANLFSTLGVEPSLGRGFRQRAETASVDDADSDTIILSDMVWRELYAHEERILNRAVTLNGRSYTVIGVMPSGFTFPYGSVNPVVWTPVVLGNSDAVRTKHEAPTYSTIARLKTGMKLAAVDAELKSIQSQVSQFYTDPYERAEVASIQVRRYADSLVAANLSKALLVLFGAAALLWLIACVNATSLLLAHSTVRYREIAVRAALGANRRQIVQQFLVEGLILSAAASLVGLGLAMLILRLFAYALATQFNIHTPLTPNASVVLVLLALTLVTALASSIWPAVWASRASVESALRTGAGTSTARTQLRPRSFLAVAEVALSLTLLIGCGLLLRTLFALRHVPLGFRTDHVVVANMTIPAYKFTGRDIRTELYQPLLERAERLPGVESASLMTEVPLGKTFRMEFTLAAEGNSEADVRQRNLRAQFRAVSPEMQRVFGFRMLEGRFFNEHDTSSSQPAVVVNRAFVKAFLGDDSNPGRFLGQPLISYDGERQATVIGILDDERQVSVAEQSQPEIDVCIPQIAPDTAFYEMAEGLAMDLAVRTDRSPSSIFPELRRLMREASPELATSKLSTMDQIVADSYGSQHLAARLLEIFSGCALLLSLAGIYGLLAYLVAQRTRELALRFALGAQRWDVMWIILRQAGWMLLSGSALGLTLASLLTKLLGTFLYGVKPHDPWTMVGVTLLLVLGGLASASSPARRAAAVDPMQALRAE